MRYIIDISIFCLGLLTMYGAMSLDDRAGKQPGQVLIPLYTTEEQQEEAVARGYTLRIDGLGGPITDEVLIEIAKER